MTLADARPATVSAQSPGTILATLRVRRFARRCAVGAAVLAVVGGLLITFLLPSTYQATATLVTLPPRAGSADANASFYDSLFKGRVVTGELDGVRAIADDVTSASGSDGCRIAVLQVPATAAMTITSRCPTALAASTTAAAARDLAPRRASTPPYVLVPTDGPSPPVAVSQGRNRGVGVLLTALVAAVAAAGAGAAAWLFGAARCRPVRSP